MYFVFFVSNASVTTITNSILYDQHYPLPYKYICENPAVNQKELLSLYTATKATEQ